ncbi:MAG TPA: FlgO family outer membrane protein [Blastocatellia bacterium]|nr:FlgO family outer membrane protein [Blastocatellia bacterium]
MDKELSANATLSHYRIVSKIGVGGMGEVYLAEDTHLERQVALKVLRAEIAEDEERVRRFIQEAKAASALNHPNILTVYEIGHLENSRYIATELIKGETLRDRLRGGPLPLRETLDVALQVAAALNAAHEAGIVHRDIKPENIMLRDDGLAKVLDFGLAKLTEKKSETISSEDVTRVHVKTSPGLVMGTVAYMSPEQARGKEIDSRSDIWSLGVVIYEMLTRRTPFAEETTSDAIAAILTRDPAPLEAETPSELQRIIRKALQKKADERYQTVKDFLLDVRNLKRELEFSEELERSQIPASARSSNVSAGSLSESATFVVPPSGGAGFTLAKGPPEGGTTNVSSAEYLVSQISGHKRGVAVGLIILMAAIGLGFWLLGNRATAAKQIESIAVMPFVNEGGNADVEYLSDGMTETLISSLSQLPNLNVKARSSVFRYKGKEVDLQKIAQDLKVQAVLTGRVMQRGDQLMLSLELVDTRTENAIWSEQYNRKQTDLVTLQSEIARDVSSKLRLKLSGTDERKLVKSYTANPEAYQFYLKGRFSWNKRTADELKQAVEYYKQAVEKDPGYALAYSGLAETYVLFSPYSVALPKDSFPQARAAALRALELDDSLAEAHAALGLYLTTFERNRSGAEKELRRAIELNPNYATAHHWLGLEILAPSKRFDEALAELRRAEELDPLSSVIVTEVGGCLLYARRYDEAIAQFKHSLTLDPKFYYAHVYLGWAFNARGMYREAIEEYRKALELNDDPTTKAFLALSLAKSGQRGDAIKLGDQLKLESPHRYVPSYCFALIHLALGERDEAFQWLEKDIEERSSWPVVYAVVPELDELRDDPRFKEMLKRLNLPE